jgi:hypothetical protein
MFPAASDVRFKQKDVRQAMTMRTIGSLLVGLALVLPLTIRADDDERRQDEQDRDCRDRDHFEHETKTPLSLAGVIIVPGKPITSADIAWVDPGTERYYFADRSNTGVDIVDAENHLWVGRVVGMAGPLASGGGTATTNGPGPNGVLVTPNRRLWAGDGNSTVQVADVDPNSANYLSILQTISTAIADCDTASPLGSGPSGHWCGRADELGYDPKDHLILIANNAPLSPTKICPTPANPAAHCPIDPYATFISSDPPYAVLGTIVFTGAGGLEQPLWDAGLSRFWITVPGPTGGNPAIVRVDPKTMKADKTYVLDCLALTGAASASITGIALAPYQHLLVSACGFPITLNALTGKVYQVIKGVGGGDEVWHNPGDGRFYVTGPLGGVPGNVQQLGVIDAEHSTLLQTIPDVRGKNPAAFSESNDVFTMVQITAAIAAGTAPDDSVCNTQFGVHGTGCIAVFRHQGEEGDDK